MKSLITSFPHGNGPYSRIVDLGFEINRRSSKRKLDQRRIIVPLIYGKKQKEIIFEDHKMLIEKNPDIILFDENYGNILSDLIFKEGSYQNYLERLLEKQPRLEEILRNYLSGDLTTKTFDGRKVKIKSSDIELEVSWDPRVATGFPLSFTVGRSFAEILEEIQKANLEEILGFDSTTLKEVKENIADKIKKDKKINLLPEPFIFSSNESKWQVRNEIYIPPFTHIPKPNYEDVPEGMYVMISGIEGLRSLFEGAYNFGLKLYCPPSITNMPNADNNFPPDFISNQNIKYQFARSGWSTVWKSVLTETPLITPEYTKLDDPEIFFNEQTLQKLGIAVIYRGENPKEVLEKADSLKLSISKVKQRLIKNYGTLDGVKYTAKIIIDYLEGKNIDSYRGVKPIFN